MVFQHLALERNDAHPVRAATAHVEGTLLHDLAFAHVRIGMPRQVLPDRRIVAHDDLERRLVVPRDAVDRDDTARRRHQIPAEAGPNRETESRVLIEVGR